MELSESSLCLAVGVYFINSNFSIFGNYLNFEKQTPIFGKTKSGANFDFKTHTQKNQSPISRKKKVPLRTFIASVSSLMLLTNFHHKWRTYAGHSKTKVREKRQKLKQTKKKRRKTRGTPTPASAPGPRVLATSCISSPKKYLRIPIISVRTWKLIYSLLSLIYLSYSRIWCRCEYRICFYFQLTVSQHKHHFIIQDRVF